MTTTTPTVFRDHCHVARLVTARKRHRCDSPWDETCAGQIKPGQQYVRSTVYPGHDVVTVERPAYRICCLTCASHYTGMSTLVPPSAA